MGYLDTQSSWQMKFICNMDPNRTVSFWTNMYGTEEKAEAAARAYHESLGADAKAKLIPINQSRTTGIPWGWIVRPRCAE